MEDFIERKALINIMVNGLFPNKKLETEFDVIRAIEKAPAVDVTPVVHAKWLGKKYNWENGVRQNMRTVLDLVYKSAKQLLVHALLLCKISFDGLEINARTDLRVGGKQLLYKICIKK